MKRIKEFLRKRTQQTVQVSTPIQELVQPRILLPCILFPWRYEGENISAEPVNQAEDTNVSVEAMGTDQRKVQESQTAGNTQR